MPRLLASWNGGGQLAISVCFRRKHCFERDRPLLCVSIGRRGAKGIISPLLEADSKWNAHEDSTVASDLMGSEVL